MAATVVFFVFCNTVETVFNIPPEVCPVVAVTTGLGVFGLFGIVGVTTEVLIVVVLVFVCWVF